MRSGAMSIRYFVSALAAGFLALWAHAATAQGTPVSEHGQLAVSGNHIVDEHGAPVTLRGMSLFWSQWMPQYYNKATIDTLASDWKVDVVRAAIGVDTGSDEPAGGILQNYEAERDRAFAVIDAAIDDGIYVVVDWHAHQPHPEEAIRFFKEVAHRYGAYPNIIYETWNEPLPKYSWAGDIKPYHQRVISAIRSIDKRNLIVAGTPVYSQGVDIAAADPLDFSNVAYVLHYYADEPAHQQPLMDKAEKAARTVPIFVSEQGFVAATGDGSINQEWSQKWWDFMNAHNISHLNWSVADKREGASALRPGADPKGGFSRKERTASGEKVYQYLRAQKTQ
ncbi:cellulase family glycosylhydrolase [Altererythrobacter indicus]|uniref:Cellulase family glycosylhydrolase n=1 Tax=Altericroceibacterium indicum TaxID=374177 RepID=A0A845AAI8_9SPHN|nr:glycoside hydrolase family 5 protein [Altericroceibacterium indicum]MXP26704.1 cellulase family glycosylhydrolase [Altericroceibacterium indicum]